MADVLDEDFGFSMMSNSGDANIDLQNAFLEISNLLERELLNYECTLTYEDIRVSSMRVVLSKDGLNYKLYWKDDIQCMTNNSRAISWIAYDLLKNGPLGVSQQAA